MRVQFIALSLLAATPVLAASLKFHQGYPAVDAYLNGQGPYRLIIDTGAQSSVLRPAIAAQLGLKPAGAVEVHASSLRGAAPAFYIDRIEVDGALATQVEVLGMDPPVRGVDGFLGQSFLRQFDYLLNYAEKSIQLDQTGALEDSVAGVGLPLIEFDGRPTVRAGQGKWILDSGASHLVFFRRPDNARTMGTATLTTSQGSRAVEWARLERFEAGPVLLKNVEAAVVPEAYEDVDGLLPVRLLRSIFVSNRKRYFLLEPRACGSSASARAAQSARRAE